MSQSTTRALLSALALLLPMAFAAPAPAASVVQLEGSAGCAGKEADGCKPARGISGREQLADPVISPDGTSLYVASADDNAGGWAGVLAFSRDPASGELTQLSGRDGCISDTGRLFDGAGGRTCRKARIVGGISDVAVSPDGRTVYTAGSSLDALGVWRRDPETGALSFLECWSNPGGSKTCQKAPFEYPASVEPSPDGRRLVVGGGSLTSFVVKASGRLGAGRCHHNFGGRSGGRVCRRAPVHSKALGVEDLEFPSAGSGRLVYARLGGAIGAREIGQIAAFRFSRDRRSLRAGPCVGFKRASGPCTPMRGFGKVGMPSDFASSPDGRSVYAAGLDFVVTDPEENDGYFRASALSAFSGALEQFPGAEGCVLFDGTKNPGCATRPEADGAAFRGARAVGVTPDGTHVLGGFGFAVALLDRDPETGHLTPVSGSQGCVSSSAAAEQNCAVGRAIDLPNAFAFSPDGRSAYASTDGTLVAFRLEE